MAKIRRNDSCPGGKDLNPHPEPLKVKPVDSLNILMDEGYILVKKGLYAEACMVWLEIWDKLKLRLTADIKSITDLDKKFNFPVSLYNWCQDLEEELSHAAQLDSAFYQKRIAYCEEFIALLPNTSELILVNMNRAAAECHFFMGKEDLGNAAFEKTIQKYPHAAWAYINWGDMFSFFTPFGMNVNYDKAQHIYQMALQMDLDEPEAVRSRLSDLYELMAQGEV